MIPIALRVPTVLNFSISLKSRAEAVEWALWIGYSSDWTFVPEGTKNIRLYYFAFVIDIHTFTTVGVLVSVCVSAYVRGCAFVCVCVCGVCVCVRVQLRTHISGIFLPAQDEQI